LNMDLKDAVDLYRDVLQRYSQGFSLEEVLGSVIEALGGRCAVLFVRKDISSFLEPRLAWNLAEAERERMKDRLIPMDWVARQPARRYAAVDRAKLVEFGLEDFCSEPTDVTVMFPIRSQAHLSAALLAVIPQGVALPDQHSYRSAAIGAVLEKMVELFSFEDKAESRESGGDTSSVELGILSSYLIGKVDRTRAASLSLDLLIKLLNMDGGTVHRVAGAAGERRATLVASRGWGGMPEIVDHLFENNLIELLQAMRRSQEGEFSLDAGSIAEHFPGVKPYFHANQVKSFLLTPIFQDDRLVGLLTLFGKAYTAMENRDMDLLVQLSYRLGSLFSGEPPGRSHARGQEAGWDFPALVEDLARIAEGAQGIEDFLSTSLRAVAVELGAIMAFVYGGEDTSTDRNFLWYADSIYGGESVFRKTPGLERMASSLQRMAVVKPDNPALKELPAAGQAAAQGLVILLVPARERGQFLFTGFYLPVERKLTKVEIDSLQPVTAVLLSLARGLTERSQAEGYRRSLEILTEIEGDLAACDNPQRALRILARGGRELLDCDRTAIVVIDENAGTFEGAVEKADGSEKGDLNPLAGREIAEVLEKGHVLYGPHPGEEVEDGGFTAEGHRSFIAVPLIGRKGRLGAITFEKTGRDNFVEFHHHLSHFLAGQAVSVLESYKEGARLEGIADENRILLRISQRLSSALTLEEMADGLYRELDATIGADLLLLSIFGKTGIRRMAWLKGEKDDAEAYDELLEAQGPLMVALSHAGKLVRNNLNTFLRGPGEDELALKSIRSYMAVALQGEELKGVLLVGNSRGGAFSEREVALIERTAGFIGSSISAPLRHDALQGRIQILEEMCRVEEGKVQTKTDLINMASHEIRHPLTLIMGFSEVLREYGGTLGAAESREVVDKLSKAADRLRRSVVNMMEVSRLESGKLALEAEEVDLKALLASLVEELQARSVEHSIDVDVDREAGVIVADRDKLEVILFNLMDNAAKYSSPGGLIEVFAKRTNGEVLVGVRDHGQGISEENMNLIFQPFRQGEGREFGFIKGMGLGLYIVNRLVEAHGGRIEVRSEHGKGSTFIAHIPQPDKGEEIPPYQMDAKQA
jgi:signal transduction histidine kinase